MQSPVFAPVAAPTTYEQVLARLGTAIRIGLLPPGTRLPAERDLADQLAISRSTLRQALAELTASGHLHARRGRSGGTFVAPAPPIASGDPYPLDCTRALLDWRMALELSAAQLAAERATPEQQAAITAASELGAGAADWIESRRLDAAFHLELAAAAQSGRLLDAMTRLQGELSDLLSPLATTADRGVWWNDHRIIAAAVASGDAGATRDAMRAHLERTEAALQRITPAA